MTKTVEETEVDERVRYAFSTLGINVQACKVLFERVTECDNTITFLNIRQINSSN